MHKCLPLKLPLILTLPTFRFPPLRSLQASAPCIPVPLSVSLTTRDISARCRKGTNQRMWRPLESSRDTAAPCASNHWTAASCLARTAASRGVLKKEGPTSRAFKSRLFRPPALNRIRKRSTLPKEAAAHIRLRPVSPQQLKHRPPPCFRFISSACHLTSLWKWECNSSGHIIALSQDIRLAFDETANCSDSSFPFFVCLCLVYPPGQIARRQG